jgi:hypothetical protein
MAYKNTYKFSLIKIHFSKKVTFSKLTKSKLVPRSTCRVLGGFGVGGVGGGGGGPGLGWSGLVYFSKTHFLQFLYVKIDF